MARPVLAVLLVFSVLSHVISVAAVKQISHKNQQPVFSQSDEVVPGVVIVKFKPGITVAEGAVLTSSSYVTELFNRSGVISLRQVFKSIQPATEGELAAGKVDLSRVYYANIPSQLDPRDVAGDLNLADEVEYAEPKYMNYLYDTPNDPGLSNQNSAFTRMNAFNGWTIAKGDSTVAIATIDGGTYWQHEDMIGNIAINSAEDINHNGHFDPGPPPGGDEDGIDQDGNGFADDVVGWNFANNTNNPQGLPATPNSAAHGTATASHFGARTNNSLGMTGSSWNCALMPVCVASATTDNSIAYGYEGIVYAYTRGAKIINCSWGRTGGNSSFEQNVLNAATQAGALVVIAAGNGTNNNGVGKNNDLIPDYPANYLNVLAVGATNSTSDARASFSNYGVNISVYAPGVNIWSAFNGGGYGNGGSGTSYSSPLTAGLAGIIKSSHPTWTPRQIATQIRVTADSIDAANPSTSGKMGRGRVNFARAFTESHPGIEIISATIINNHGSTLYLSNDTVIVTVSVQNILFVTANNLTFTATTSDASLAVVQGTANAGNLAPGQQATLVPFKFRVGALTASKDINIKLTWLSNTNDRDAYAFKVTVFPSAPRWEGQISATQTGLFSVKVLDANVAWACGGNGSATAPAVIRTTDGGNNWTLVTGNLTGTDLYCIAAVDANRAWVGTGNVGATPGKIFATTNGGTTWTLQAYPVTQSPFIDAVWFIDANNGYAMGDPPGSGNNRFIVVKTTDGGVTWAHTASEPLGGTNEAGWNNSFSATDVNHLWFGTNLTKTWRSTDAGTTWASTPTGTTNSYAVSFKDNSNGMVGHDTGLLQFSSNGGVTWTSISSPATTMTGLSFLSNTTSAWFSTGTNPYRTTNNGSSWTLQTLSPFTGSIQHMNFADTSSGWAVTSNGEVLHYRPSAITGVEPNPGERIPTRFALEQNYPNPFNPTTMIKYQMPASGNVSLKVFDVLGREIVTLVDGQEGVGEHTVEFNASALSTGVYFYQLQAGAYVETKKLMILK